jgi:hypothetical protein
MTFSPSCFPMKASKWLSVQVLIDYEEMQALCLALAPFEIYQAGSITSQGEGKIPLDLFLEVYHRYIEHLKAGELPQSSDFTSHFSTLFTLTPEVLFSLPVKDNRQLLRLARPAIQLQPHSLHYSPHDKKFRAMIFGADSVSWGIQFSYPQLFQDPISKEILSVGQQEGFPNTPLFRTLQRWMRQNTIPTPFRVDGGPRINVPMRLGKQCLTWINQHPQLKPHNLDVIV